MVTPLTNIQATIPKSSPIPLSTASMLAYEPSSGLAAAQKQDTSSSNMPPNIHNPQGLPGNPIPVYGNTETNIDYNAVASMDFSSLGMDDLSAFMTGNSDGGPPEVPSGGLSTQAQEALLQNMFPAIPPNNNDGADQSRGGGQSETDQILASLSQSAGLGGDSLGDTDFNFDFSADFGGTDMDFSELVGLFDPDQTEEVLGGSGGGATEAGKTEISQAIDLTTQSATTTEIEAQAGQILPTGPDTSGGSVSAASRESEGSLHRKRPSIGVGSLPINPGSITTIPEDLVSTLSTEAQIGQPPQPQETTTKPAPNLPPGTETVELLDDPEQYDLSNINLDDFNFGEGGMPMVEGDEFESLFAEFK